MTDEELTGPKEPREKTAATIEAERRNDAEKMKAFFSKDAEVTGECK